MKIANYENQLIIALTPQEYTRLGADKLDVEFIKGEGGFIALKPGQELAPFQNFHKNGQLKDPYFRVRIPSYMVSQLGLKYFGSHDVETTMVGDRMIGGQPNQNVPRKANGRVGRKLASPRVSHMHRQPISNLSDGMNGLEGAINTVNRLKRDLGDSLVIEVNKDGYLEALVQYAFGKK